MSTTSLISYLVQQILFTVRWQDAKNSGLSVVAGNMPRAKKNGDIPFDATAYVAAGAQPRYRYKLFQERWTRPARTTIANIAVSLGRSSPHCARADNVPPQESCPLSMLHWATVDHKFANSQRKLRRPFALRPVISQTGHM